MLTEKSGHTDTTETWAMTQNQNDELSSNRPKDRINHSITLMKVPWACLGRCTGPQARISWKYRPDSRLPADARPCLGVSERNPRPDGEPGSGTAPSPPQNLDPCPWRSSQPSRRRRGTAAKLSSWLVNRCLWGCSQSERRGLKF